MVWEIEGPKQTKKNSYQRKKINFVLVNLTKTQNNRNAKYRITKHKLQQFQFVQFKQNDKKTKHNFHPIIHT